MFAVKLLDVLLRTRLPLQSEVARVHNDILTANYRIVPCDQFRVHCINVSRKDVSQNLIMFAWP